MIKTLFDNFSPEDYYIGCLFFAFVIAFIIANKTFPTVLYIAKHKQLMDEPDARSLHANKTPTLGGISIFFSLIVVMTLAGGFLNSKVLLLLMGGLTILFFLGLKDDLTTLSPRKKIVGQILAAGLLIVFTDTRIIGFSHILDINVLPYGLSIVFTLFVYVLIINAYNLIDGVDGLAGTIALTISGVFVFLFINGNDLSLATVAIALCGALIAFLRWNFSTKNKIFMGDTGSMIVGFLLAFFTISFINMVQKDPGSIYYTTSPALALALLFYPLVDTFRVFFIRIIIHRKSPFKPDKNHIHHRFIAMGLSHMATTLTIVAINLIIICIAFNLLSYNLNDQILCLLIYGAALYYLPFVVKKLTQNYML
ncbi:undecaprenyl/decaprenyl-phosphate alpha-N-acetylglucosaminyl 1-phosphate transferase [Winogradskyella sp.]|nr:undecaprenyl/decaprenyl-phosphate alpha-N-acetylglucosaminyl 1-phosphate transferase [Winogradskyella sp.]